jgi:arsenite-transporting ATPase
MVTTPAFLLGAPRFYFFTGKGGVGKTSIACATAVRLADQGRRVLLVSTDPASNVGQVFGLTIGAQITAVPDVPRLQALEIDPEQAAVAYRERVLGPLRGRLPDDELDVVAEQLSGSCTTEVASFDEFTALLTDPALVGRYDHIVFDTAPTGHTIRLLQLPGSWTDFLEAGKGEASCLGPMAGLDKQRTVYAHAVEALKDTLRTRVVLVAKAQTAALVEAERTRAQLAQLGIRATHLAVNAVLPAQAGQEPLARALRDRQAIALQSMAADLAALERDTIEERASSVMGAPALRGLLAEPDAGPVAQVPTSTTVEEVTPLELSRLVETLAEQDHGLVMCMGKGGVGKTTIAAALAVALAHRGHQVHLATTDPAGNLLNTLRHPVAGLTLSRINPGRVTSDYRDHVMATKGARLDPAARAALAEDLQSPCTEEVAVFREFSKVILRGRHQFVVVDTAPTGHTLLLLDAAGSYHRDVVRQMGAAHGFATPMMLLQDPDLTKVVIVTLAEPTPVAEARALHDELARAGITPWAWVVNGSLAAARPESPFLQLRAAAEAGPLAEVMTLSGRVAVVPVLEREPIGEALLGQLAEAHVAAAAGQRAGRT